MRPASSNSSYALGTLDWFGMVNIRIQRPSSRSVLTVLKDCDPALLNDLAFVRGTMLSAASEAGGTILGESFHEFTPQGVTGIVVIAESHLCIHTWPEYGYAAVDIFTCGDSFVPQEAANYLIEQLRSQDTSVTELQRGIIPQRASTAQS